MLHGFAVIDLLARFKSHANIGHNLDDALCSEYLSAATAQVESEYGVAVEYREVAEHVTVEDGLIAPSLRPHNRLITVQGRTIALGADGRAAWYGNRGYTLQIEYSAGYKSAADIPANIAQAIFKLALHLMEHRGDAVNRQSFGAAQTAIPQHANPLVDSGCEALMRQFRRMAL